MFRQCRRTIETEENTGGLAVTIDKNSWERKGFFELSIVFNSVLIVSALIGKTINNRKNVFGRRTRYKQF